MWKAVGVSVLLSWCVVSTGGSGYGGVCVFVGCVVRAGGCGVRAGGSGRLCLSTGGSGSGGVCVFVVVW